MSLTHSTLADFGLQVGDRAKRLLVGVEEAEAEFAALCEQLLVEPADLRNDALDLVRGVLHAGVRLWLLAGREHEAPYWLGSGSELLDLGQHLADRGLGVAEQHRGLLV